MQENPYIRPTLLLICKYPVRRAWLCKHLADLFEIIVETDPEKALTAAECIHLDFIMIDAEIIEKDLLKYCHQMRMATLSESTDLYLITGKLKKDFLEKVKKQGITDFIHSQLNEEEVKEKMQKGIANLNKKKKAKKVFSHFDLASLTNSETKKTLAYKAIVSFAKAKDKKSPSSIVMIKVNHFAELSQSQKNDLQRVIQSNLKHEDILIPTDEGHFIVVLPNLEESKAKNIALDIQSNVSKLPKSVDLSIALSESSIQKKETSGKQFKKMIEVANKTLNQMKPNQIKTFKTP